MPTYGLGSRLSLTMLAGKPTLLEMTQVGLPPNKIPLNLPVANIEKIKEQMGSPPWNQVLVGWERMVGTLICQAPGQGNNGHHHLEPEWWVVVEGELEWRMDDKPPVRVGPGDFVYCAPHVFHKIDVVGDKPAIRLAIGEPEAPHVYSHFGEPESKDTATS